jgi:AcrR family transcriptional regulator
VAEHRANVQARLVDAAELILRFDPGHQLTAGAVTAAAGIARNSIYRYVDSVEDLRALVVDRYLPDWFDAVSAAMTAADTPVQRVVAWAEANLRQAAATGHGWLMEAARALTPSPTMDETVVQAHRGMRDSLADAWQELFGVDQDKMLIATALTVGILDAGFRQLDAGRPAPVVLGMVGNAARALVVTLRSS